MLGADSKTPELKSEQAVGGSAVCNLRPKGIEQDYPDSLSFSSLLEIAWTQGPLKAGKQDLHFCMRLGLLSS